MNMGGYSWIDLERERERIALIKYMEKATIIVSLLMIYFLVLSEIVKHIVNK